VNNEAGRQENKQVATFIYYRRRSAGLEFRPLPTHAVGMEFITVYRAFNPADAELVRSRLEANEFLVNMKNENAALSMDGYAMAVGGILVQVPEDQVENARRLLESKDPS
jgi:hypothetical protein